MVREEDHYKKSRFIGQTKTNRKIRFDKHFSAWSLENKENIFVKNSQINNSDG